MSFSNGINSYFQKIQDEHADTFQGPAFVTAVTAFVSGARYYKLSGRDRALTWVAKKALFSKPVIYSTILTGAFYFAAKAVTPIASRKNNH